MKMILTIWRDLSHEEMAKNLLLLGDKLKIATDENFEELIMRSSRHLKDTSTKKYKEVNNERISKI
jgi:hypothetical protein